MNLRLWLPFVLLTFPIFNASARIPRGRNGAQNEETSTKSAREEMGLRGPVKSCAETWAFDGRAFSMYNEFDRDGKMLVSRSNNPDGSEWVTTRTYDENGRLLKSASGKTGETPSETIYTYDDQGRLVSVTNSSNKDRTDIQYDDQGHKTEVHTFDPKTLPDNEHTGFSGSTWFAVQAGFGVPAGGTVVTIYDENNRPVEEQVRDADGQVVSRVVRTYNAAGLMVEEKPVVKNPSSVLDKLPEDAVSQMNDAQKQTMTELLQGAAGSTTFYAYDAQGRVTMKRRTGVFQSVTVTSYNDHGDMSEDRSTVISVLAAGVPLSIAENGIIAPTKFTGPGGNVLDDSDARYSYQYDDYGNWTERTTSDAKHPDAPATVRRRTLTYY